MEPIDQLERRAASGDVEAKFDLAAALLSKPDSGFQLPRAISLIEGASAAGHAPASELCAIFEAMGVARPKNWSGALDLLLLAARQGSSSAKQQLLLLAGDSLEGDLSAEVSESFWGSVRQRISVEKLFRHGERRALSESPRIRVIDNVASATECQWVIDRARDRLKPAMIFDASGKHVVDPGRTNSATAFDVLDMDIVLEVLRERISAATRIPLPVFEPVQVFHYSPGEEFKLHHDFLEPDNPDHRRQMSKHGQRIATFLVYLNDEFEGGETEFPRVNVRYRGKVGDAIFWANVDTAGRPDPLTLHAGRPTSSGDKWVLSQWIRDRSSSTD